jgi:hypothetical protein
MGCRAVAASASPSAAAPSAAGESLRQALSGPAAVPQAPGARSQLAEQNDLYASALAARERGDSRAAVALFERLVKKYPSAPLAENAMAERMKVLAAAGSRRAADAARDYLARYPAGFARADAESILAGEKSGL